jgi:transitional endoplasmic reticulum ATPase
MKLIYPSKNKGVFEKFNRRAGGGLLLYGPPGCGKTAIAQAAAGECGSRFIEVSVADVLSKWFGESERRIRDLFDIARSNAPAVVFIDEIDALGVKRSDASGAMAGLVNVLLGEVDRTSSHNTDILIIGATNTPWRVDSSFRRPGRFDQTIFVPPPDSEARASILELLLRNIPTTGIETASLVEATHKFSGADLRAAVDAGIETAITEEMKTGNDTRLSAEMLMAAIKATRPTTLEWLEQAANYASYANASGLYDDLATYIKDHS